MAYNVNELITAAREALDLLKDKGLTGQIAQRLEKAIKKASKA